MLKLNEDRPSLVEDREPDDRPHAVVIGAGFGGLAAALRLTARGYRVTVLEHLDGPGGRAYVYRQDGFTFDAGPTIVTAPWLFDELWELFGRKRSDDVTFVSTDPFYRMRFDDGSTFDYNGDRDAMRAQIAKINPADVANYDRFMEKSREIFEVGFLEMADRPLDTKREMLEVFAKIMQLGGHRTVYGQVASYFKDERLRLAFSFHPLLVGGNPTSTTAVYNMIGYLQHHWGVHFAMGGTGALVQAMVSLLKDQGGSVRYHAKVDEILVEKRKAVGVRLDDGEHIAADVVVSNADAANTYRHLLRNHRRRRWTDAKTARVTYSMSLFVWYFGTDIQYHDVPHHTLVLGPRYQELLADIFKRKKIAADCSLYLHRPTATDPSLAPQGKDAFYVLSPVPHLDSGDDWTEIGEGYRKMIEDRLAETVLPELGRHICTSHFITPLDFQDRLLSYKGAAFGLEPVMVQSAYFRPHTRSEEVENLFLVGAGTHPGAGLPGVLTTAKVLEKRVPDAAVFQS